MIAYRFFRFLFRLFFSLFYRYQVIGGEHIPKKGAVLVCSNHIHAWDPPLVGCSIKRQVRFMAKSELFSIPILSFFLKRFGTFPVKRGSQDKQALRMALSVLHHGEVLGLFPEGTRSETGKLGKGFTGVGLMALKEAASVVPVAIIGPYRLFKRVKVVIGPPVALEDLRQDKLTSEKTKQATERIMASIQHLLDQSSSSQA